MTVTIDPALHARMARRGGGVDQGLHRMAVRVHARAAMDAPVDTGRLAASGYVRPAADVAGGWDVVFPVDYFRWVHDGTKRMRARPFLTRALASVIGGG